jgi:hypothetical protein
MVTLFRKIDLKKEEEFEKAIAEDPSIIEEGLTTLMDKIHIEKGQLDILCIDSENALTLVDIEIKENDAALFNALKYYDWMATNIETVKQLLKNDDIDVTKSPRLILLAPTFSQSLLKMIKHGGAPKLELFEYTYLKTKSGEEGIHLEKITKGKMVKDIILHKESKEEIEQEGAELESADRPVKIRR